MLSTIQRRACRSFLEVSRSFSTTPRWSYQHDPLLSDAQRLLAASQPPPPPSTPVPTPRVTPTTATTTPATTPEFFEVPPERDPVLHFLTTSVMDHGRYARAQKVISEMLLHIHTLTRSPPVPIVHEAIRKASPAVRVKSTKVGARSIVRPVALSERQRTSHGIRWILEASKNKPGIKLQLRLAKEMISVIKGDSAALKKKEQVHKAAMVARGALSGR
ncbi:ribosomal protein S7 [Coprinopsis cinerea okayama7|uniref:Ribosomal protein S7 n=1 Tax=Coprinopsis cinerea (strain Okayama-7 / 130 / ATCC MYA-4618 / FGSC 9003) TaxID=240176 RepID=A8PAM8_COPC7|nr:ribosomal protein S7 [Coprinopsis cinerea okayama7\|eukprot:XP_001840015.1 ribosomal protein S7 [Coprinopsis cinerea okayama7\